MISSVARCPRCKGSRIQRGYKDVLILLRLIGLHEVLCNTCGLEFKGFDPFRRLERSPSQDEAGDKRRRRRAPRYRVHLPATISLIEGKAQTGKVSYSQSSRGHCEAISKFGLTLSFVGTRFPEEQISRNDSLLFVSVDLPDGSIDAVVSIVTNHRPKSEAGKPRWVVGVSIRQMTEANTARLDAYLEKRAEAEPILAVE